MAMDTSCLTTRVKRTSTIGIGEDISSNDDRARTVWKVMESWSVAHEHRDALISIRRTKSAGQMEAAESGNVMNLRRNWNRVVSLPSPGGGQERLESTQDTPWSH